MYNQPSNIAEIQQQWQPQKLQQQQQSQSMNPNKVKVRSVTGNNKLENQDQKNTAWKAKKVRQDSDQQVLKLINRIKLLQKEDQKNNQKLVQAKKKTISILQQKKKQEEEQLQKKQQRKSEEILLKYMQNKQQEIRHQQSIEKLAIRNAVKDFKKEERDEINKMSRYNSDKIKLTQLQEQENNVKRHQLLQSKKVNWKQNYQNYWGDRQVLSVETNQLKQLQEVQLKKKNDELLSILEAQELEYVRKLQHSQNLAESAIKELEDIKKLSIDKYEQAYKRQLLDQSQQNNKQIFQKN